MDKETIEKLLALNREFYAAFAQPFADSRSLSDPALTSILPHIPQRARVLDVGCGVGMYTAAFQRDTPDVYGVELDRDCARDALGRAAGRDRGSR